MLVFRKNRYFLIIFDVDMWFFTSKNAWKLPENCLQVESLFVKEALHKRVDSSHTNLASISCTRLLLMNVLRKHFVSSCWKSSFESFQKMPAHFSLTKVRENPLSPNFANTINLIFPRMALLNLLDIIYFWIVCLSLTLNKPDFSSNLNKEYHIK